MTDTMTKSLLHGCAAPFIGAPVTFLGLTIFVGGVENAWAVLVVSVVCTAGIGLVFWIPLCWLVGSGTLALIGIFVKKPDGKEEATRKHTQFRRHEVALADFFRRAKDRGMSDDKIVADLRRNGWSDSQVQKARRILDS